MFSAGAVDIESNILVLEGEASGCEVLTVKKKIRYSESNDSVNSSYCISLQIQRVCISENL